MQVTLKKAGDFAKALLEEANKVVVKPTIKFPTYEKSFVYTDIVASLAEGQKKAVQTVADVMNILTAHFEVRDIVGKANAQSGLSTLLNRRVLIDTQEKRLRKISDQISDNRYDDNPTTATGVQSKIDTAKIRRETHGYGDDHVDADVTAELRESLLVQLAGLKRDKNKLNDEIAFINMNTKVELPKFVVDIMRERLLID